MRLRRLVQSCGVVLLVATAVQAQSSDQLKIYINTDLEGISGVYQFAQSREHGTPLNLQACEFFMDDLAAVIRGLRDAGVDEILVLDGHGSGAVLPDRMAPGAKYVVGRPRSGPLTGLDDTFDGMIMLGFHAMMGTADGVLNHTQSSKTENRYWYNGVESGELAQSAIVAAHYGVPVIMVTGDAATCREGRTFFGDGPVTVAVKEGLSREAAILYPMEETRQALYEGAKQAVAAIARCKPYQVAFPMKGKKQYLQFDSESAPGKLITKEGEIPDALHLFDL